MTKDKRAKRSRVVALATIGILLCLPACSMDDREPNWEKYADWRERNQAYVDSVIDVKDENGEPYYTMLIPDWAPEAYALVRWHNDTMQTCNNLVPMDNSSVEMTYELFDIDGKAVSNSFANPDSIYYTQPQKNITGVWYPLTRMHVGDSVTIVMPSQSGYGAREYAGIKPYSALIYNIKLKAVKKYEIE